MEQKLIFFDIDGTLIDNATRSIPASAAEAVRKARAAGHLVYVNTGRSWPAVDPRVRAVGFDGYVCGCGVYVREGDTVLFHQRVAREAQLQVIDLVRELDLQVMYEGTDGVFFDLTRPLARGVQMEKRYYDNMGLDTNSDPAAPGRYFDKFVILTDHKEQLDGFYAAISPWFQVIDREGALVELVPHGCSKGGAMELLLRHHGRTREDCIAFGDSLNDRSMFEAAGISVAMGNSDPRLFPYADMVTTGTAEDGIARAMDQLGLTG